MPEPKFSLGVDFGTNSVRALIVETSCGEEVSSQVWDYRRGDNGIFTNSKDPNLARQHPQDYFDGFLHSVSGALQGAARFPGFKPENVVGIGVDTTGSTPVPVSREGVPLACLPDYANDLNAYAWLWKDHTAHAEAAEITARAHKTGVPYLRKCGGTYSSEWFWSKILHCARVAPETFSAAYSWMECQDLVPAWLTGNQDPAHAVRGACAAGHKAMFHHEWDGLPSKKFLDDLDPRLADLRDRLYSQTKSFGETAGLLTEERAEAVGLPSGIPVSVGAMDAHLGAVGSGIKLGTLVKIMGTSTCDIMIGDERTPDIPGVCGVVPDSVVPGYVGIEAGQSAVGDLFNWCVSHLGHKTHEELSAQAEQLKPGESGLLALDWNNGNRTILVDPLLCGLLVGQTLHTSQHEIYRALIEATAMGARKIIEQIEKHGVQITEIVVCGGIAEKSPLTMQIYADVCNRPMKAARSSQACALGAAIGGAVVGGAHQTVLDAVSAMTGVKEKVYVPDASGVKVYDRLYRLYGELHDTFGRPGLNPDMFGLMKELIAIRDAVRAS